jgi:hypothetical protein
VARSHYQVVGKCILAKKQEGSKMKVTGEYMKKRNEMFLEVVQKEQNRRLVTRQTEGSFQ